MSVHVVIIGCGFGGLAAARALKHAANVTVTLIDRSNHHLFQPLLYQVATAGLPAPSIAAPIRHILRKQRNLTVLMAQVPHIDRPRHIVLLDDGQEIKYDYLILAAGATHSYFNHPEWAQVAPGLKTLDDAFEIRRRVLRAFEQAELHPQQEEWLTFAVIGAGPTGVEMAGTLAEIARNTLRDEFRNIDSRCARIILIEGSERVLPSYPTDLSAKAQAQLKRLGVMVRTQCRVTDIDKQGLWINAPEGKQRLQARTIIWAAGVAASPLGQSLGVPLDRAGRVIVEPDLSIPGHPEVFVIGDLAAAQSRGQPVPGVSPAAKQMGRQAASNILRSLCDKPRKIFYYHDYGSLATIGRNAAVAMVGPLKFSGIFAWLFWLFVHIFFLIGFRNRIVVMLDWAWAYWTFARYARVFTDSEKTN